MKRIFLVLSVAAALSACGERPQALQTNSHDTPAFAGTGKAFADKDWKQGDKGSWESHMRARGQHGQNDYNRMN